MPALKSPTTGEILVLNAGAWTGVYGQEASSPIIPTAIVAPFFVAPIPTTTGSVVKVDDGDWTPTDTVVSVQIGTGLTVAEFVPHILTKEGTIPPAMNGLRMTALVDAVYLGQRTRVLLDSGVTISGTEGTGFPPDIAAGDWTAAEVRDSAPEGRRRLTVDAGVTVPGGYALRLYSGPTDGGDATAATAAITPGGSYTTVGTLPIGSTAYNRLYWLRASDAAIAAATTQKSFVMEGLLTTGTISDTSLTPDVTVATVALARAQATTWIANWASTIPNGKTGLSDRVIRINASVAGMDLTGLQNTNATTTGGRIIFRTGGTFSDFACTQKVTGIVNMNGSRGIGVALLHVVSGAARGIDARNSVNCLIHRCMVDSISGFDPATGVPSWVMNGIEADFSTNLTIRHCIPRWWRDSAYQFNGSSGSSVIGAMANYLTGDFVKMSGNVANFRLERTWGPRRYSQASDAGDPHEDFVQHQLGSWLRTAAFWGNVYLTGERAWWTGPNSTPWANQGIFIQPAEETDVTIQENILAVNNNCVRVTATTRGVLADNTFLTVSIYEIAATVWGSFATTARNFIAAKTNTGMGTDGVFVAVGTGQYTDRNGVFHASERDYADLAEWFANGIPLQNASGTMESPPGGLSDILPVPGTRLHWAGPGVSLGARIRTREIFDVEYREEREQAAGYPIVPGDVGWPVAGTWQADYNANGFVRSKYSTAAGYDANGDLIDLIAPTLAVATPANGATGVLSSARPTLKFSERVKFGTGFITLREQVSGTWSDVETFDVATEVGTAAGQVSRSLRTVTIRPTVLLVSGRRYALRVAATAITDLSGNAYAGIADDTTLAFTAA